MCWTTITCPVCPEHGIVDIPIPGIPSWFCRISNSPFYDREKECGGALFFPILLQWGKRVWVHFQIKGKKSVGTFFLPICTVRWKSGGYTIPQGSLTIVIYSIDDFHLQYGGNLKMYSTLFFPIVIRWEKRSVPPTLFFSPSSRGITLSLPILEHFAKGVYSIVGVQHREERYFGHQGSGPTHHCNYGLAGCT